jgi:hypothetical protein
LRVLRRKLRPMEQAIARSVRKLCGAEFYNFYASSDIITDAI